MAKFSDIHGNYPALQAVLEDSYKQKIDHYIFLGDYVNGLPFTNEVVNKIKNINNQYTICGNHENYLRDLTIENKLLINPGSCGLPCDLDNRSPYTILSLSDNSWSVDEKRIPYDIKKVKFDTKNHKQFFETNIWPLLNLENMKTGRNQVLFFLNHVEKVAQKIGDTNRPYSNYVWQLAATEWNWKKGSVQ